MKSTTLLLMFLTAAPLNLAVRADEEVPLAERAFRVIDETQSPDKRFALGVGLASDRAEKGQPRLCKDEADFYEPDTPGLCNYLVDVRSETILAVTGARHFGTRPFYNHYDCEAHWSPDGRTVLQLCTAKWDYTACVLMRLSPDGRKATLLNLGPIAVQHATTFLKTKANRGWRKHSEKFAIDVREPEVTNDTVALTILGQIPKSDARDSSFEVRVKMRIKAADGELRAEPVSVRYADAAVIKGKWGFRANGLPRRSDWRRRDLDETERLFPVASRCLFQSSMQTNPPGEKRKKLL